MARKTPRPHSFSPRIRIIDYPPVQPYSPSRGKTAFEFPNREGVLVEYQPGGSNPAHTHPDSAFIYATVLEGAIRSKVNDGPEKVCRAGESWAEVPGDHHAVSANASETEPARLLAVFVVDTEKNLVTNDK